MLRRVAGATVVTAIVLTGSASAATKARPLAYVPSEDGGVSVLNTATGIVVATVPTPGYPQGVAVTPDGRYAYVPSWDYGASSPGTVSVIDTRTNTAVATVPVDTNPSGVAITPNGRYAYVTNRSGDAPLSSNPILPPDGAFFSSVSVISTATRRVVAKVGVGYEPVDVALSPNGAFAYVINEGDIETFDVINTKTNRVAAALTGRLINPSDVAVTPDGRQVLVTGGGALTVIDASSAKVAGSMAVPYRSDSAVTVAPSGRYAYVTTGEPGSGSEVEVVDLTTRSVASTISVADYPSSLSALALSPDGRTLYAADSAAGGVAVIDTSSRTATSIVPVGADLDAIAVQPAAPCGKTIYERLKCNLPKIKTYVSCGVELATFEALEGLKLLKAIPKAYKNIGRLPAALRPAARLYNKLRKLRLGRRTTARTWRDLQNSKSIGELVSKIVRLVASDVDLHRNDVAGFLREVAGLAGVDDCVDAVLGALAPQ